MLKTTQYRNLYALGILMAIAIITISLELTNFWFRDNIAYGFYPYLYNHISHFSELMPVNTIGDVIDANNQNYLYINGRYVAHFFVILFCGILGKGCFAVCNALVWATFVTLLMRISDKKLTDIPSLFTCAAISLYLMVFIGSGPANQINYVWMFTLSLGWLILFHKKGERKSPITIALLGIFSLIAGNGQEGLNIGICGALLVLLFVRRFRFSPAEWAMGICFAIGCMADCLSPGTLSRSGGSTGGSIAFRLLQFTWVSRDLFSIPLLFLSIVIAISKSYDRQQFSKNWFFWCALTVSIIFLFALGYRSGNQYFGMMLIISILILRIWTPGLTRNILSSLIVLWCLYSLFGKYTHQNSYSEYMTSIERQYEASPDGTIFIDASNPNSIDLFFDHRFCIALKSGHTKKITALPQELNNIRPDSIVNFVKSYPNNRFLIVQSKINPKRFLYNLSFRIPGYTRVMGSNLDVDFTTSFYENDTYRALNIIGSPLFHHEITMVNADKH